jgi:DNA-binding NarL/FixJ family response regulator
MMPIQVLLVDDHAIMRDGLRLVLEMQPDIRVIGEAANGRDAVRLAAQLHPEVVVMDITMPELNGIEAARQMSEETPDTRVVILSMHSASEQIFRAFKAGARGYLLKESAGNEVVDAVRAVHGGMRYLSQRIAGTVLDDYMFQRQQAQHEDPLSRLTAREREVLQLVVEGKSSVDIGAVLSLSPKTVESYRSRLMQKLGVENLAALIRFAIAHGITPP